MLREPVIVSAVHADFIKLKSRKTSVCQACQLKSGCGQQILQNLHGDSEIRLPAGFTSREYCGLLEEGQEAFLEIEGSNLVAMSLLLYVLPLGLLLITVLLSALAEFSEATTVLLAFSILGLSFCFLHRYIQQEQIYNRLSLSMSPTNKYFDAESKKSGLPL